VASAPATAPARQEPTSSAPKVDAMPVCEAKGRLPLQAAQEFYDAGKFEQALSCAAQACALFPGDVLAHTEKGNALAALERFDEAKLAFARALALEPESLDALLGAAHLYGVALPSSREHDALASLYAERGFDEAQAQHETDTAVQFARLGAMIFNDLGQAKDALERADWVLSHEKADPGARYERAVALFELLQFDKAKKAFGALLEDPERAAHAHHHLGLILEREGKWDEARTHFEAAQKLSPEDFPAAVTLPAEGFAAELKKAIAELPTDMRSDLEGVPIAPEDLPRLDDLDGNDPPLSPTILGLFRGPPRGEACEQDPKLPPGSPCRSVVLYRLNLARAVKTREELLAQIRVTLLHEIGHLRGEDDDELAARGLE
jgi:tetratricopeptide (TPR) repeat protein